MSIAQSVRDNLSPEEQRVLERLFSLSTKKWSRIVRLLNMLEETDDPEEYEETKNAIAEILFRPAECVQGAPLEKLRERSSRLEKRRSYVGAQIKRQRELKGMTQGELAEKAGIPQSHVCRLETGKHAPSYKTINKVAAALGVKPSQLDPSFDD